MTKLLPRVGTATLALALAQTPSTEEIERLLGEGRSREALAAVDAALGDSPARADLLLLRGVALLRLDRAGEATAALASACGTRPSERRCALLLGRAHLRAGNAAEAGAVVEGFARDARASPDIDALYGNALAQLERYDEAIPFLERAVASSPEASQAAFFLGQAYLFSSRFEDAARVFRTGMDLPPPRSVRFALGAAEAELRNGRLDEAKAVLDALLAVEPGATQGYLLRAAVAVREESFTEAADHYRKAIEGGHRAARTFLDYGVALAAVGEGERAVEAFDEALELDPKLAAAHYYKGVLTPGRLEAIQHLQTASALAPEPSIELALAEAFNRVNRPDLAVAAAEKALADPSLAGGAHFARAVAEHQRLRYDEAEAAYLRASSAGLESADLYFNLGRLYTAMRRPEDAVAFLEKAAALEPDRARSLAQLGVVLQQKREWDRARGYLVRATELEPENAEAWHQRGIVESAAGRSEEAVQSFRRALEVDAGKLSALYRLGTELSRVGASAEAEEALERFRALSEERRRNEKLATELGVLFSSARRAASEGREDEAVGFLAEARALAPDHPAPYLELARLHLFRGRTDAAEAVLLEGLEARPGDTELGALLEEIRK